MDKNDFDDVLSASQAYEWDQRLAVLKGNQDIFEGWATEELVACNKYCRLEEFAPNIVSKTWFVSSIHVIEGATIV